MPPKKSYSLYYIFGSIILIFAAIVVTTLMQKNQTSTSDIRARAGVKNTLRFTGLVVSVDTANHTFVLDNVKFENSAPGSTPLGTWTVTPPPTFALASLFTGSSITISVAAETFAITSHTVTATDVKITR